METFIYKGCKIGIRGAVFILLQYLDKIWLWPEQREQGAMGQRVWVVIT